MASATSQSFSLNPATLEPWLAFQVVLGVSFLLIKKLVRIKIAGKNALANDADDKNEKARLEAKVTKYELVVRELSRKSFHILGGTTIVICYHFWMKYGILESGYAFDNSDPVYNFSIGFTPFVVFTWSVDFLRQVWPGMNKLFSKLMGGLLREKEKATATGMSYFLPGALCAIYCYPPPIAMLAILHLTLGDAAAALGCAAGKISIGGTPRKLEGSLGCAAICFLLNMLLPTGMDMGTHLLFAVGSCIWAAWAELWAEVIRFDDNLFVPVVSGCGMQFLLSFLKVIELPRCFAR